MAKRFIVLLTNLSSAAPRFHAERRQPLNSRSIASSDSKSEWAGTGPTESRKLNRQLVEKPVEPARLPRVCSEFCELMSVLVRL